TERSPLYGYDDDADHHTTDRRGGRGDGRSPGVVPGQSRRGGMGLHGGPPPTAEPALSGARLSRPPEGAGTAHRLRLRRRSRSEGARLGDPWPRVPHPTGGESPTRAAQEAQSAAEAPLAPGARALQGAAELERQTQARLGRTRPAARLLRA